MSTGNRVAFTANEEHPRQCPWCGQSRIRGVMPSPDGNRWYRCTACATTFFIHVVAAGRPAGKNERRSPDVPLC